MNPFPTVQLPGVTVEERDALTEIHDAHRAKQDHRFAFLTALVAKGRTGPLYAGSVPGRVKAARRRTGKAQRIARALHRKAAR
ncbi:hypothetical protein ACFCV3_41965 [Kribbella sp. NPDC056345]|uniref:hypothetical protein n=1 Tax=Kribbella sp. NPDC056345 TaxID=3345789 RepID=UPI0035E13911